MRRLYLVTLLALSLLGASSAAGQAVGAELQVNTYTTDDQGTPDVATGVLGDFIVVWESAGQDGDGLGVFGQRYDSSGLEMGVEFQVNTYTTGDQRRPSVAIGSDSFLVVWRSAGQDGSGDGIFAQLYDTGGVEQGIEFQVNSTTTYNQYLPNVAGSSNGSFVVVWGSYPTDYFTEVRGQRFDSAGMPQGMELYIGDLRGLGGLEAGMDSTGGFVVTWREGPPYGLVKRFDSLGTSLGSPVFFDGSSSSVAVHSGGSFVLAYDSTDYGPGEVKAQRFDSGGTTQGVELTVNTYTTGSQIRPKVAMDGAGNFVVTWSSGNSSTPGPDGDDASVAAQRFSSAGDYWGDELVVNTVTAGNQILPAVAADADGRFIIAWESGDSVTTGPDGSGTSVQAQRFDPLAGGFADLAVTKEDGLTEAKPGEAVTYTIVVTNDGPSDVAGVDVADSFPAELEGCSWTSVASGGATGNSSDSGDLSDVLEMPANSSVTYTVDCTIALSATTLANTVSVSSMNPDPNLGNNSATDDDTILRVADLAVTQSEDVDPVGTGEPLTYTITISNIGPLPAESVTVTDFLPSGASFVSAVGTGWLCQSSGPVVLCSRPTVAVGTAPAIAVTLDAPLVSGDVSNTVVVSTSSFDPDPSDNVSNEVTGVFLLGLIFSDGFESGDTSLWSSAVPPP